MSGWVPKRFWTAAEPAEAEGAFTVLLDGRSVKTPTRAALAVPTRPLAEAIAAEWRAQGERIDPTTMPFTRSANAAIDKVAPQFDEVAEMIAAYGDSDLICYRSDQPQALVERQATAWDPLMDWAATTLGAPLQPRVGVMHIPQTGTSLAALAGHVRGLTPFELTALHDLVTLSGSLVIGLAAFRGLFPAEELWLRSRIDESWQQEVWGADEDAAKTEAIKRAAFLHAAAFLAVLR